VHVVLVSGLVLTSTIHESEVVGGCNVHVYVCNNSYVSLLPCIYGSVRHQKLSHDYKTVSVECPLGSQRACCTSKRVSCNEDNT
jgi:hypothetical protein